MSTHSKHVGRGKFVRKDKFTKEQRKLRHRQNISASKLALAALRARHFAEYCALKKAANAHLGFSPHSRETRAIEANTNPFVLEALRSNFSGRFRAAVSSFIYKSTSSDA